jgi:hypothetical protein
MGTWGSVLGSCGDGAGPLPATSCARLQELYHHGWILSNFPVRMLDRRTRGILWGVSGAGMFNSYDQGFFIDVNYLDVEFLDNLLSFQMIGRALEIYLTAQKHR